jgi:DNA repair exonuclease SbcCD ATPase subunit
MSRFGLGIVLLLLLGAPSLAQSNSTQDAIAPVEEFSRQLGELKKTFAELGKKIDDSAKAVDGLNDVEKARKEIEELRAAVSTLLGTVVDNGDLARLGNAALARSQEKLRALEQETRFKPEERAFLIEQWRKIKEETERASSELGTARREFAGLLRTLQANEDFIDELIQIRQAKRAIEVIRQLTRDIRGASDQLKTLIGAIKPPGV